ncbi:hypothetical protein F2Q69_00024406 [Brassica cretica]|uniref:Uncharacterized protein n=1 Tax=Brassica cretica TaxID=69181 RepID=A0A8S9QGX7_BRACR|nr:hypothetical protein F2Q69_00024406 [Brassica cretica]
MKNGDWSIIRRATRVAAPRVHLPASPKDQFGGGPRGKDHAGSTTRSHELEESSRSDAGDPHLPLPALPKTLFEESRG